MAAGLALMACMPSDAESLNMAWRLALRGFGFGFGFFQSPNNFLVLTSAPIDRASAAAGMQAIARHIGQIGGATIVGTLFMLSSDARLALAVASAIAAAGALVSLSRRLVPA